MYGNTSTQVWQNTLTVVLPDKRSVYAETLYFINVFTVDLKQKNNDEWNPQE
ncbi:hypothetical protein SAMN05216167_11944 [Spirosoma endophyticum]|uniref:Uncharacterized protein n=1 Tax=Spirosoma endophyticum TaxID=662367 RepID=A0A1I2D8J8_9BACT|nr:hypothetical protein SAMN05216167_11944 [Spirosoma endophyticum]